MTSQLRASAYGAALSTAYNDLEQIRAQAAELLVRRDQMEKAVAALKWMVETGGAATSQPAAEAPTAFHEASSTHAHRGHQPVSVAAAGHRKREAVTDPLQQQIDHALGLAALA